MKRLNNKGTTIIEIILCFALASLIIFSLYNIMDTISTNKRNEEAKFEIVNQKTLLTKNILSDIVQNGLQSISINGSKKDVSKTVTDTPAELYGSTATDCLTFNAITWQCSSHDYVDDASLKARSSDTIFKSSATSAMVITFSFKNGEQKELRILKQVNNHNLENITAKYGDKFYIAYGTPENVINTEQVGKTENKFTGVIETINFDSFKSQKIGPDKIYETQIGNININKSNQFLKLDLRFNDIDLKQRYGLYIVTPTTIDQAYVDELTDLPEEEEEETTLEIPDRIGGVDIKELLGPISWDQFDCTVTGNYCVLKSFRATADEDNPIAEIFEEIEDRNKLIFAFSFPYLDESDTYKNSGGDISPAIRITKKDGTTNLYQKNWSASTLVSPSNIQHELKLNKYEEVVTENDDGTTTTEVKMTSVAALTDNVTIDDHQFQLMVSKDLVNLKKSSWSIDQFNIYIYEYHQYDVIPGEEEDPDVDPEPPGEWDAITGTYK